jgi:hypothetical protein
MKLITETIEDVKCLTEEKEGKKSYFIEGIFLQSEVENRNHRVYPKSVLQREVARYVKEYIEPKRAFGELGHPDSPHINLDRVSHMIVDLHEDGNNFIGKAKILDTPFGKIVKNFMDEGATIGVSSRGMGSLKPMKEAQLVQDDYYLATAADIVADPSAPDAFVRGIMENKEWMWNNGLIKEADIAKIRDEILGASRKQLEEVTLRNFESFLKRL